MERIFDDENQPFWRSAKRTELGVIDPEQFRPLVAERFTSSGKAIGEGALELVLATTEGHPYATQELCYFLWQRTPPGWTATVGEVTDALADVLRSEDAHFTSVWDGASSIQRGLLQALAAEEGYPFSGEYRRRHGLPPASSVQRALGSLVRAELVTRSGGRAAISEPFLAQWLQWKTQ